MKLFSIKIYDKDSFGNPTNRFREYGTDSAYKLWKFYMRYQGKPKNKKRKGSSHLPNAQEAQKILNSLYEH